MLWFQLSAQNTEYPRSSKEDLRFLYCFKYSPENERAIGKFMTLIKENYKEPVNEEYRHPTQDILKTLRAEEQLED